MKQKISLIFLALFVAISVYSAPVRNKKVILVQPDGTAFQARVNGDEFMKVITTEDGCAVIQDAEKWWCYALYDGSGNKISSGQRLGAETSSEILSQSRSIPYQQLSANARTKRASQHLTEEPLMKRLDTKSGGTTKHGLIILAEFADVKFTYGKEDFVNMLTQSGYDRNGAIGSAKEYFDEQFGGSIEFDFDVSPIITLTKNVAYYGRNDAKGNDLRAEYMIYDACVGADEYIDFSLYDDDKNGWVDNVFVFFAGADEAEGAGDDRIWSHAWNLRSADKSLTLDGVNVGSYACTAELAKIPVGMRYKEVLAGIGVFCHEYFHTFGIPDFYDTDYEGSGGRAMAMWMTTSLMDAGNQNNSGNTPPYLNAIERDYLGLTKPITIKSNGSYTLEPIHLNGQYYRIDTDNKDEYYILECRSNSKWDEYIGGNGMLVYHIDKSSRNTGASETYEKEQLTAYERWEIYNEVNCRPDHQCADLVEADGRSDIETDDIYDSYNIQSIFFPTSRVTAINPSGNPSFKFWSGEPADLSITNIKRNGSNITFNVVGLFSVSTDVFADAAIISVEYDKDYEGDIIVQWSEVDGQTQETIRVEPYAQGKYSVTLEGLKPNNITYKAKISIEVNGVAEEIKTVTFMTKKSPAVDWPYMALGDWNSSDGVRLPLRLYNADDAAEIRWTYNGAAISRGGSGYFVPQQSGTLRADIVWSDGTEETIVKEITIGEGAK